MKNLIILLMTISFLTISKAQDLTLVKNGKSDFHIIIPKVPDVQEIHAAKVLQDYLNRISGFSIPIRHDDLPSSDHEILIGKVDRQELAGIPFDKLGLDGLFIQNTGQKLIITGGPKKGIIYGVYTFLEKYLGCKKYSSTVDYIPRKKTIKIGPINDMEVPVFSFREVFYHDVYDPEYMDWHKLHSHGERGSSTSEWGYWVHTFHNFLDPKEYGESNPEYFSFYDGKRHPGLVPSWDGKSVQPESQLCLSNPEVLEIVSKNLKAAIDKKPEARYWSVSQNDNVNYCRCEHCAALDAEFAAYAPEEKMYSTHGSEYPALGMGSMLSFVNKVAERFPDKIISTLAYQYTRVPPKGIVPRENVNIMLCSIESTRNEPMETGDVPFSSDLEGWGKLTDNILVWDYTIQFSNLLSPFPNLRTLQPNVQFLRKNRVSAVFEQGNIQSGGEFAELRAYLLAKLLWNPDMDLEDEMDGFLKVYYGKAANDVNQYISLLHDNNQGFTGRKLSIFGGPLKEKDSFLTPELIDAYNGIFDKAEAAVRKDPIYLNRVKSARLPVQYAKLEIQKEEQAKVWESFGLYENNRLKLPQEVSQLLYDFIYHCMRTNVSRLSEWHTPPKEYLENYPKWVANKVQ
ncbi:protein of unknown function [Aquiflexum balticum DSM 16537]|uniref:Glycosyl hydrolase family 67 N-terminus n=1 Tax=Aquiflexum balticum DSM 16537 TaxID=758820 RepID=A0A1W2H5Q2_9BACT|nr:DUF4838 domain-containing protein [Aquiflexum balticum]SMD43816.1 protein of unknown function [Aquiflexum balticum DSM 16537]